MSHTTAIKSSKITNISALHAAVDDLRAQGVNISIVANAKPRAYYQNQAGMETAAYVIQLPDSRYDIGVYALADGSGYEVRTDMWGGDVQKQLGGQATSPDVSEQAKVGRLYQMYGINAAEQKAHADGLQTQRTVGEKGSIELLVTGY